jgi:hypothetical protein
MRHPLDKRNAPGHHTGGVAISETESAAETTTDQYHRTSSQGRDQYELVTIGEHIAPAGRRTLPAATARCADCGVVTVHRNIRRGVTQRRVGTCGHRYRLHVVAPTYAKGYDDTDVWADEDGTILRGDQTWMPRAA